MSFENIQVLVLDDEAESLARSKEALASFLPEGHILTAVSAVEALRILESRPVDMVFVDIEMPGTGGFSVAEFMKSTYPEVRVVFLTGHVELGAKSFDYEPFDFLGKPIDLMRLRKTLERFEVARQNVSSKQGLIAVDTGAGLVMLSPEDILYIAKEKRKTVIYCQNSSYTVQYSLEEMEAIFEEYGLFRTHQSFLVPLNKIVSVQPADFGKTYTVQLMGGKKVPMSRIQYGKLRGHLTAKGVRIL